MTAANVIPFQRPVQTLDVLGFDPLSTRTMPDREAAYELDGYLRFLEAVEVRSFILRGLILIEVQRRALWRSLSDLEGEYHSFEDWVNRAAPRSRSSCYAAKAAAEALADIPPTELIHVTGANVGVLRRMSSNIRTRPEVLEAAQYSSKDKFVAFVEENFPNQHIQAEEDAEEEAVKLCMAIEGLTSRKAAKACIYEFYLANHMGE